MKNKRHCCVPRCPNRACASPLYGHALPCCAAHMRDLPGPLLRRAEEAAGGSPFDPHAVLKAATVIVRIKKHFGQTRTKASY